MARDHLHELKREHAKGEGEVKGKLIRLGRLSTEVKERMFEELPFTSVGTVRAMEVKVTKVANNHINLGSSLLLRLECLATRE